MRPLYRDTAILTAARPLYRDAARHVATNTKNAENPCYSCRTWAVPTQYHRPTRVASSSDFVLKSEHAVAMVGRWYGASTEEMRLGGRFGSEWEQSGKASRGGRGLVATWRAASRYRRHIVPMGFTGDSWVEHKGTQRSASPYGREGTRKWGGAPTAPPLLGA